MNVFPSPTECILFAQQAIVAICLGIPLILLFAFSWLINIVIVISVYPFILSYNISYLIFPFWASLIFGLAGGIALWITAIIIVLDVINSINRN
jgi:hypothetical protein